MSREQFKKEQAALHERVAHRRPMVGGVGCIELATPQKRFQSDRYLLAASEADCTVDSRDTGGPTHGWRPLVNVDGSRQYFEFFDRECPDPD